MKCLFVARDESHPEGMKVSYVDLTRQSEVVLMTAEVKHPLPIAQSVKAVTLTIFLQSLAKQVTATR